LQIDDSVETVLSDLTHKSNAAIILKVGISESSDPEELASSILSSGAELNPRTAKILARLNLRRIRESEHCTHAWRDWTPPEEPTAKAGRDSVEPELASAPSCTPMVETDIFHSLDISDNASHHNEKSIKFSSTRKKTKADGIPSTGLKNEKKSSTRSAATADKGIAKIKKEEFFKMMSAL